MTTGLKLSHSYRVSLSPLSRNALLLASLCLVGTASTVSAQTYVAGPQLAIDARFDRHGISEDIYGVNDYGTDSTYTEFFKALKLPVKRSGGNATTRYNWKRDASNSGNDWFYIGGNTTGTTNGKSMDDFVRANKAIGAKTILTVPLIDYINNIPSTKYDSSFPLSLFPNQTGSFPWLSITVNGVSTFAGNGISSITNTDIVLTQSQILRTHIKNTPTFQQDWIKHLVATHKKAQDGGVAIYQLDNEPSGWGNTHRDVHPGATGYDELVTRSINYATAIKAADSSAAVLGPGDFGPPVYLGGGKAGDDAASHGGIGFADYYLSQMRNAELLTGKRLLDYFDEHYYPQPPDGSTEGIALSPAGSAANQAARLNSTRALWDPNYQEPSWYRFFFNPVQLLPRMRQWVEAGYPGTKLAITEYNFGGLESINGALAQADVLGIFGREGLDLATMWGPPAPDQPGAFAFKMFRNYDGNGSAFGDIAVRSQSKLTTGANGQGSLSVYAAERSTDGALTVVAINKTGNTLLSNLTLAGFRFGTTVKVYRYSEANLNAIVPQKDIKTTAFGLSAAYPPRSITLFVFPKR